MAKQLSVGSEWIWLSASDPGVSETGVFIGNWWLNTVSGDLFICKNQTVGAEVWALYPTATVSVSKGGTGDTSVTAYAPICGGTTTTGAFQSASTGIGTSGFVLTSTGASSLPTFQTASASGALTQITGSSGGAQTPSSGNFNILGTGSITTAGTANTETISLTGLTNHALQVGAGTATLTQLGAGTTGQVLQTNTTADPTWSTATYPSTTTANRILYSSGTNVVGQITSAANGILVTDGSSVPSISSTLPSAVQGNITSLGALSSLSTAPAASQSSSLTLGAAYQNPFGYDVVLVVYLNITVDAGGNVLCGVGPTNTPTQQTINTGLSVLGYFPVTIYLPKSYYALLSVTLTASIVGQQAFPV